MSDDTGWNDFGRDGDADPANNQVFIGTPSQYQKYKQLRLANTNTATPVIMVNASTHYANLYLR